MPLILTYLELNRLENELLLTNTNDVLMTNDKYSGVDGRQVNKEKDRQPAKLEARIGGGSRISGNGAHIYKGVGVHFADFISFFLNIL